MRTGTGGDSLGCQLWLFWLAPLVGAALAGLSYAAITGERITAQVEGIVRTEEPSV